MANSKSSRNNRPLKICHRQHQTRTQEKRHKICSPVYNNRIQPPVAVLCELQQKNIIVEKIIASAHRSFAANVTGLKYIMTKIRQIDLLVGKVASQAKNPCGLSVHAVAKSFFGLLWDNSSPSWVGWRDRGYREGTRSATQCAITTVRTSSRKGSGSLAGYAQSPRGASSGATGNELEANTRAEQPNRTYVGAKVTGASLPLFTVRDGCQVLIPQRDASETCPITVPAA